MDDDNENENKIVIYEHNDLNPDDENLINQESNDDYQNESIKQTRNSNTKFKDFYQFFIYQQNNKNANMEIKEYDGEEAEIMLMFMQHQIAKIPNAKNTGVCNSQTNNQRKGILKYENKGKEAVNKELFQLHNRGVFKPIHLSELTQVERYKAMNSLTFLTEKRDGTVKARACANGSTQQSYNDKQDTSSLTVTTETLIFDAKQNREVVTLDIPNAFIQNPVPKSEEKVVMRITGLLVDYLVKLFPTNYNNYVTIQNQTNIQYLEMRKSSIWNKAIFTIILQTLNTRS